MVSCAARAFVLAVALAGLPGLAAAELCVLPLEGGGPINAVEEGQPWRILFEVASIPGYPLPLIWPGQRDGLYTVRGMRFEPLGVGYPALGFFQWRDFAARRDGTVIGFGQLPSQLWILRPGEAEFSLVPDLPPLRSAGYDAAEDRVYMQGQNGGLYELHGEKAVLSLLDGAPSTASGGFPRLVETLGGYLAATETSLWFHPRGAGKWQSIADTAAFRDKWSLKDARIVPLDGNTVAIGLLRGIVVLRAQAGQVPVLRYSLPWTDLRGPVGGSVLTWQLADGSLNGPRDFAFLTPDGPVAPPGDPVPRSEDPAAPGAQVAPDQSLMLVRSGEEVFVFDGSRMVRRADLDSARIGSYPRFVEMLGKTYLRTTTGWYAVGPGLTLSSAPLPFPVEGLRDDPITVPSLGGALLVDQRGGTMWFTGDGGTFAPVRNLTGAAIDRAIAPLPERAAAIALTRRGAAIVQACPD